MKKDRNYWLERGKNGNKRKGYICIGKGDCDAPLKNQIDVKEEFLWMDYEGNFSSYFCGNVDNNYYYLKEQKFNELFPENKNMNRKFRIKSEEHSRAIQNRLFELDLRWIGSGKNFVPNVSFIYIRDGELFSNAKGQEKEITLDDLYKEDFFFKPIKVKLNSQYTAVVHKDKIVVGCQEFTMEVFEELKKAVDKVKEKN